MCYIGDLEPCSVWDEKQVKARRPHHCSCCKREITVGEIYLRHFNVFEGDASHEKLCMECEKDRDEFGKAHDGMLPMPGGLKAMLHECIGEEPEESDVWRAMIARIKARGPAKE